MEYVSSVAQIFGVFYYFVVQQCHCNYVYRFAQSLYTVRHLRVGSGYLIFLSILVVLPLLALPNQPCLSSWSSQTPLKLLAIPWMYQPPGLNALFLSASQHHHALITLCNHCSLYLSTSTVYMFVSMAKSPPALSQCLPHTTSSVGIGWTNRWLTFYKLQMGVPYHHHMDFGV